MHDLVRGPRSVAAAIAARLARVGAPLDAAQYRRLVEVVAKKEDWECTPMSAAARRRVQDGCRRRDTVQAANRPETVVRVEVEYANPVAR